MATDTSLGIKNIGPETEHLLRAIGITSKAQFEKLGAQKTYRLLLEQGHKPSRKLRLMLKAAEEDIDWRILAEREKRVQNSRLADWDEP